jgi:hypothetical protein
MPGRKGSFFCGSSSSEWFVGLWCVELLDVIIADNMGGGCSKGKNESTYDCKIAINRQQNSFQLHPHDRQGWIRTRLESH